MNTKTITATILTTITLTFGATACATTNTNEDLINNSQVIHRSPKTTHADGTTTRTITIKTPNNETHTCVLTNNPGNNSTTADKITCDTNE